MTPTQFKEAVEIELVAVMKAAQENGIQHTMGQIVEPGSLVTVATQALAAIQTATAELLEGLKAEHNAICGTLRADNPRDDCKYPELVDQIIIDLRQKAKELKQ